MSASTVSLDLVLKRGLETSAAAFQARLVDALRLGADGFWQTDACEVIRQVMSVADDRPVDELSLLENKALTDLLGMTMPAAGSFRDLRAEVRALGGSPVAMSLSGRRAADGTWHGIVRLGSSEGGVLNDQQVRRVLDRLRESRDRELLLRQETETLLDGLRLMTSGRSSTGVFSALLTSLAPMLEFEAAVILQRGWAGAIAVAAATEPALDAFATQEIGAGLMTLDEVAVVLRLPDDLQGIDDAAALPWQSGLAIRLHGGSKPTVLLCLHTTDGAFTTRHLGLGARLSLLASQAFQNEEERQNTLEASKLATIGEMAAGIVHEINQPLTAMTLGLSNLKDVIEDGQVEQASKKLSRLEIQAQRIARIIASMRTLARRTDHTAAPFKVRDAVLDALSIIEHKLTRTGIRISIDVPDNLVACGDGSECAQVILNILSNAHDAVEASATQADAPRQPAGEIALTAFVVDASWIEIEVRDTGGGFPPDSIEKALLPFYTTKAAGKGTGLGLALCRRILGNMGGSISLANWEQGAVVRVRLPQAAS